MEQIARQTIKDELQEVKEDIRELREILQQILMQSNQSETRQEEASQISQSLQKGRNNIIST